MTAMEEFISELKRTRIRCLPEFKDGIDHAILRASAYLETEKKQIVEAYYKALECDGHHTWFDKKEAE